MQNQQLTALSSLKAAFVHNNMSNHLAIMYAMQSASNTMRRTLRPVKSTLAPTGNRMLDIAIRMAGNQAQQEQEDADAAAAAQ